MDKPMKEFAVKIVLDDGDEDTIGFVARYGFKKALQNLLWAYQNDGKEEGGNT